VRPAGLLLSAVRAAMAGDIDRHRRPPGAQQQQRRSTALSSKREQCRVNSRRRKLNTDVTSAREQTLINPPEDVLAVAVVVSATKYNMYFR